MEYSALGSGCQDTKQCVQAPDGYFISQLLEQRLQ